MCLADQVFKETFVKLYFVDVFIQENCIINVYLCIQSLFKSVTEVIKI